MSTDLLRRLGELWASGAAANDNARLSRRRAHEIAREALGRQPTIAECIELQVAARAAVERRAHGDC